MKTILFLDHTAKMGGGEIALLNLVSALDRTRFHPVVALAADGPLAGRLREAGIETHVLPLDKTLLDMRKDSLGVGSLLHLGQIARLTAYTLQVARWARRRRVDLIHTNSLKSDVYGGIAGRLAGIPVLWHVRDHVNVSYLPPVAVAGFRALSRLLPRIVVANSESTLRQLWPHHYAGGEVVHSGVAREIVHDGYPMGPTHGDGVPPPPVSERPTVALIGRITEWKGQHVLLRAAAHVARDFPEARFWIIGAPLFGEYEYETSLHVLAEELGMTEQVEFLGFRDDIPALMPQIDIVVHASILGEPFGQVVIEGMAAGKPLVATDGGALPEIVVPGETGLLVPMGDDAAMAEALRTLLSDPVRARAMGKAGRERVARLFTIRQTALKVEAIYEKVFAPPAPGKVARVVVSVA